VAEVLQHELCHALDEQEDLSSQREELFLDLFKPIVAETLPDPDLANDEFGSDSERVRETFAYTCEAGSDVLPWLADSCNAQAVELGRWLDDQVWVEVEELDYRTLKPSWLDELELDCAD
jgi:hypothetical protein